LGRSGRSRTHDPSFSQSRLSSVALGNLQPLPPPDPFDTLGNHRPALGPEHRRDAAISIAAVARGQLDDVGSQRLFICPGLRFLALGQEKNLARRSAVRRRTCPIWSINPRRRAGLTSFPKHPRPESTPPALGPTPPCAAARSLSPIILETLQLIAL
jgi:hypothetical protein